MDTDTQTEVETLDFFRTQAHIITERLEKGEALQVMKLFHAMELFHQRECWKRDTQLAQLDAELERFRLMESLRPEPKRGRLRV